LPQKKRVYDDFPISQPGTQVQDQKRVCIDRDSGLWCAQRSESGEKLRRNQEHFLVLVRNANVAVDIEVARITYGHE
jgi:predicted rRNA methylase YqxC with S4 and FtsJ domains